MKAELQSYLSNKTCNRWLTRGILSNDNHEKGNTQQYFLNPPDGIGDGKELWTGLKRTVGMSSDCCGSSCNAYLKWKVSGSNYVHQDFVEGKEFA